MRRPNCSARAKVGSEEGSESQPLSEGGVDEEREEVDAIDDAVVRHQVTSSTHFQCCCEEVHQTAQLVADLGGGVAGSKKPHPPRGLTGELTCPGAIVPGHQAMVGSLMPPSKVVSLPQRKGPLDPPGEGGRGGSVVV